MSKKTGKFILVHESEIEGEEVFQEINQLLGNTLETGSNTYVPSYKSFLFYIKKWIDILDLELESEESTEDETEEKQKISSSPSTNHLFSPTQAMTVTFSLILGLLAFIFLDPITNYSNSFIGKLLIDLSLLASVGGFVGISTNWLAITMLFRPYEKKLWLGGYQGVIPANKEKLSEKMAEGIRRNMLDKKTIQQAVRESNIIDKKIDNFVNKIKTLCENDDFRTDVEKIVETRVRLFFANEGFQNEIKDFFASLSKSLPENLSIFPNLIGEFLGGLAEFITNKFEDQILNAIENNLDELVEFLANEILKKIDDLPENFEQRRDFIETELTEAIASEASKFPIEKIVKEKLQEYSIKEFEELIKQGTDKHLRKIQFLGLYLGAMANILFMGLIP